MGKSVIQEWVTDLTFMQQTVLLSAIRGCDGIAKLHNAKPLVRWYRRCVVLSAMDGKVLTDPWSPGGGSFTGPLFENLAPESYDEYLKISVDSFVRSRDDLPLHYVTHTMHAFQIVGYKHPDPDIRKFWLGVYTRLVHAFHLWPETEEQMDKRLGDTLEGWREREDAAGSCST